MKRDDWSRSAWCLYLFSISGHWQQRRRARPYWLESKWCVPWPQHTEDLLPAFQPTACHRLSLRTSTQHSALMYILSWLQADPFLFFFLTPELHLLLPFQELKKPWQGHLKAFSLTVLWKSYLCTYIPTWVSVDEQMKTRRADYIKKVSQNVSILPFASHPRCMFLFVAPSYFHCTVFKRW